MKRPNVCVARSAGTNCDYETAFAFEKAGARAQRVHINALLKNPALLEEFQILALPGGFSYGDDIASGRIFANELRVKLGGALGAFIAGGKLIIGICNGFQILVKAGILPGNKEFAQEVTLTINDSGKFEDRWTYLKVSAQKKAAHRCVWAKGLSGVIYLPVAHGEGKFMARDASALKSLEKNGYIVFRYCGPDGAPAGYPDNPNGSQDSIAGITDATGRILGMMPHPERHIIWAQHPRWEKTGGRRQGDGLQIFRNGVEYAAKHLV